MAERNPVIPVRSKPASEGNAVVSWPNALEPAVDPDVYAGETTTDPVERAQRALEEGVTAIERSFREGKRKASRAKTSLLENIQLLADERPLRFVAVIAGIAFVTGIALRIWRSRYE